MKRYKVILTESEMQKLKHLVNEKVNDGDVDVNVGGSRLHKNLKKGDNYLKKMIIDLLKSETDFKIKINANNNVVVKKSYETCYIIFDDRQISLIFDTEDDGQISFIFDTEKDLDMQYNIDDYNDRGRNGLETLAKTIVSEIEKNFDESM